MKELPGWLTWSGDTSNKQPFQSGTHVPASTNQPGHLVAYDVALNNIQKGLGYAHLGFVPCGNIVGMDIDACRNPETLEIAPWARTLIKMLPPTYVEITPSEAGLRAWVNVPHLERRKRIFKIDRALGAIPSKAPQVETLTINYGCITGRRFGAASQIAEVNEDRWNQVAEYLQTLAPKESTKREESESSDKFSPDYIQKLTSIEDGDIDAVLAALPGMDEGGRDNFLASVLGKLHQSGWSDGNVLSAAETINTHKCIPPIGDPERIARSVCRYEVKPSPVPLIDGVPAGSAPHVQQQTPVTQPQTIVDWRSQFKTVGELEQGDVKMLISDFIPEGTIFIGGLPGEGKTLFALSIAKALTTGKPFLGKFMVPEVTPVIYLIPESGGRAFRKRCEAFKIPNNPNLFLCRTVSEGSTLPLDDASLFEAIKRLKPIIILDTIIRFSEAQDENQAMQNKALVDDIIRLRQAGAVAVIGLHHATKAMREKGMSLETCLRGTGDIAACADAVYGLLRDSMLYDNGMGPNEVDIACLKPRDFQPPMPFRIAMSRKPGNVHGIVVGMESIVDLYGDLQLVTRAATTAAYGDILVDIVSEEPTVTLKELHERTKLTQWTIRTTLKDLGWTKDKGGTKGGKVWAHHEPAQDVSNLRPQVVPITKAPPTADEADVNFR
jgi:hypothetical protein